MTDSYKHRIDGLSIASGLAFFYETPAHLRFKVLNSALTFLVEVVYSLLCAISKKASEHSCAFGSTRNNIAVG